MDHSKRPKITGELLKKVRNDRRSWRITHGHRTQTSSFTRPNLNKRSTPKAKKKSLYQFHNTLNRKKVTKNQQNSYSSFLRKVPRKEVTEAYLSEKKQITERERLIRRAAERIRRGRRKNKCNPIIKTSNESAEIWRKDFKADYVSPIKRTSKTSFLDTNVSIHLQRLASLANSKKIKYWNDNSIKKAHYTGECVTDSMSCSGQSSSSSEASLGTEFCTKVEYNDTAHIVKRLHENEVRAKARAEMSWNTKIISHNSSPPNAPKLFSIPKLRLHKLPFDPSITVKWIPRIGEPKPPPTTPPTVYEKCTTEEGIPFYYNTRTGASVWEKPHGIKIQIING